MAALGRYLDAELVERLDRLRPAARRGAGGADPGSHRSLIHGSSLRFRQHRAYTRGDDPRRLDWRVLARTDRLFVKQFDHDTNLQVILAVDVSGSMAYGSDRGQRKSDFAAAIATALGYLLLRRGESVGLSLLGASVERAWLAASVGPTQLALLVSSLEEARSRGPANLPPEMHRLGARLGQRSLVILCSDFLLPPASLAAALAQLANGGHQTVCLQILHPDEVDFPFQTFTRFTNLESNQSQVVEPSTARVVYLRRLADHRQQLAAACAAGRSPLRVCRTDQSVISVVHRLLHPYDGHPRR